MKRKKVTKHISFMLVVAMLVQMIVVPGLNKGNMTVEAADSDEVFTYEENFDGDAAETLLASGLWDVELNANRYKDATAPKVVDGVVKMDAKDSVQFNWPNVPNVGTYDSTKTYTFEFDVKVTDFGDNTSRNLYVAPGGYWNQVEFNAKTQQIDIAKGADVVKYADVSPKSQKLHVKLEWLGTKITSTISDKNGNKLGSASRVDNGFTSMTANQEAMTYLVLRCEGGGVEIDDFEFKLNNQTLYTENFEYNPNDILFGTGVWTVEDVQSEITFTKPEIKNGVMQMDTRDSVYFFWQKVPGVGTYDSKMTYTFEFDAKITDDVGSNFSGAYTRPLYVAPGGWFNQIGIKDKDGKAQVGESSSSAAYDSNTYLNKSIHIKIEWLGKVINSTITNNADGAVIATGSRTNEDYNYGVSNSKYMRTMAIRCEDGAVEIDNFKFTKELKYETSEQSINIPAGHQAVYECDITYNAGAVAKLDIAGQTSDGASATGELFRISDDGMAIGGYKCAGTFGTGTYKVKCYLNPTQKAVNVEVTLPNGGVIRRGSHALLNGCVSVTKVITGWKNTTNPAANVQCAYEEIDNRDVVLDTNEPPYGGFEAKVYNLVTAFDVDAKTTRTFAWTALESFIGQAAMAVQYRVEGTTEWTTVDAVKEIEKEVCDTENYFKADIYHLTTGTTYEYRIGKKASTDSDDWSKIYTFTTEAENVDEFSFVAIGDSQGADWNGDLMAGRGYKYAQAALNQAVADTGNPAFILHTGDITEHGTKQSQWNYYFKALGDLGKTIPHFAAVGNHDVWSDSTNEAPGSAVNFDLHFNHPNNGGSAAFAKDVIEKVEAYNHASSSSLVRNLDETTYSFNYGNTHFVVLNTGAYDKAAGPIDKIIIEAQTEWLINDLEANKDAEWTILMMHEPLYHRLESHTRLEGIHKVIEEYGVDLAILGHSHLVTRTYPMKDGQIVTKAVTNEIEAGTGTVYSTIGSTVASHDQYGAGVLENMHTVFTPVNEQPTYTTVSVDDGEIKVTIKQVDGLVVDEYTIFKEQPKFLGASLTLSDKIGVNFYVSNNYEFSDDAYVEFTLEDGEQQTVLLKDADVKTEGKRVTCWVPAKEMADTITATLYEGGEAKATMTTSVKEYAQKLFDQSEKDASCAAAKPLVNAMINYGTYAQLLFNHNVDKLANSNEGYNKVYFEDNVADVSNSELDKFAKGKQGKAGFGHLAGATLVLKEEIKLKLFFEFESGVSLEGLTFSIDGVQQTPTKSDGYYVVEIKGITASLLDLDHTVKVSAGDNSFDAVTSVMTGCYNALNNPALADMHNIAKALYLYNDAADTYRNGSN